MSKTNTLVEPISGPLRQQVIERTRLFIGRGSRLLERDFDLPEIRFDLRGRAAGQFRQYRKQSLIRYNPWVFAVDFQHHLAETVPHEVAHYLVFTTFGRVKPHGEEWRLVMRAFGVTPRARGDYNISGVRVRRQRRYRYRCLCREHELTTTRHNRVQKGVRYYCRGCGELLVYLGEGLEDTPRFNANARE